uniref:hypothetical protein n=1 Tax=Methylobacterium nigriterrae TaxID=3127512 RepID=UPI0030141A6B
RMSALAGVDLILTMQDGRAQAFGPKEQVLARRGGPAPQGAGAPERPRSVRPSTSEPAMPLSKSA